MLCMMRTVAYAVHAMPSVCLPYPIPQATRLRQEYIELLNMEQEVKAHASVIEALRDSYAPSGVDPTDFKTFIDKAAAKELKKQK